MNTDHFTKGKSELCQDYALSGLQPFPYAIIADGCSSTKYSDVGSMVLAHAARYVLGRFANHVVMDYHAFGKAVLAQAENVANTLGRPKNVLDSTLGIVWKTNEAVEFRFYGDGIFFYLNQAGELWFDKIEFQNNMPYYLRYWTDPESKAIYEQQTKTQTIERYCNGELVDKFIDNANVPISLTNSFQPKLAGVCSDGFGSLFDKGNEKLLEIGQVMKEATAFKNKAGEFVVRRLRRMLTDLEKQGIKQTDDIAMAVINLE